MGLLIKKFNEETMQRQKFQFHNRIMQGLNGEKFKALE